MRRSRGPLQDASLPRSEENIPLFIITINKRQRQAIEQSIKEKYYWQQADKKVVKAVRERQRKMTKRSRSTEEPVLCRRLYHQREECGYCQVNRSISIHYTARRRNCTVITRYFGANMSSKNTLMYLQEDMFTNLAALWSSQHSPHEMSSINKSKMSSGVKTIWGVLKTFRRFSENSGVFFCFKLACHK